MGRAVSRHYRWAEPSDPRPAACRVASRSVGVEVLRPASPAGETEPRRARGGVSPAGTIARLLGGRWDFPGAVAGSRLGRINGEGPTVERCRAFWVPQMGVCVVRGAITILGRPGSLCNWGGRRGGKFRRF